MAWRCIYKRYWWETCGLMWGSKSFFFHLETKINQQETTRSPLTLKPDKLDGGMIPFQMWEEKEYFQKLKLAETSCLLTRRLRPRASETIKMRQILIKHSVFSSVCFPSSLLPFPPAWPSPCLSVWAVSQSAAADGTIYPYCSLKAKGFKM